MNANYEALYSQEQISRWRSHLKSERANLQTTFYQLRNTKKNLADHAALVDGIIQDIWRNIGPSGASIVAVGGYGRGELYPFSDVDILILRPDSPQLSDQTALERMISLFWDIGLELGHSVRTIHECVEESNKDVTVLTNLIEARYLAGDKSLYQDFSKAIKESIQPKQFFYQKLEEQSQRYHRFNDTTFNLEPNIKESPGGLRDIQIIFWLAKTANLGKNLNDLVKADLISQHECRLFKKHERHLQTLRIYLHYFSKRREDKLIFDLQNSLADTLGFKNTPHKRASEQLMQEYYRSARYISVMNEILLLLIKNIIDPKAQHPEEIYGQFMIKDHLLSAKNNRLFQKNPSNILDLFSLFQRYPDIENFDASLLRTLIRIRTLVNREFRNDPKNQKKFLDIIKQMNQGTPDVLKKMNRYGILGRYIPSFGKIVGQMQHDLFHVYTVDEHTLNVMNNLHRFSQAKYQHEFPLCHDIFSSFDKPELIYLGALFHDIAKGRGGDHSTLGMVDARKFCKLHGLDRSDTELVTWLVGSHLTMSSTAQKSDLSDPKVIENFANFVGNERRLVALYLLTVADIRGTSPKVWNAWKAKLLETLFLLTKKVLRMRTENPSKDYLEQELKERQHEAVTILRHYSILESHYKPLWESLGELYFLKHTDKEIAWHTRMLISHVKTQKPIVRARLSPDGDGIDVMIYTPDRKDLFARICIFFERLGYNILEAKIYTTQQGYAMDSFLIQDASDHSIKYRDLMNYIEYELTQGLTGQESLPAPIKGRLSRQVRHMPIETKVTLTPLRDKHLYSLEIIAGDSPGLLSTIAQILRQQNISIHSAKINTLGNRVEDLFVISDIEGKCLSTSSIETIQSDLLKVCDRTV
jgi:[protein-PII] uridylyltransferase